MKTAKDKRAMREALWDASPYAFGGVAILVLALVAHWIPPETKMAPPARLVNVSGMVETAWYGPGQAVLFKLAGERKVFEYPYWRGLARGLAEPLAEASPERVHLKVEPEPRWGTQGWTFVVWEIRIGDRVLREAGQVEPAIKQWNKGRIGLWKLPYALPVSAIFFLLAMRAARRTYALEVDLSSRKQR